MRIEAIPNRVGNGYVKCLIPVSPRRPHRSEVDHEYYLRLDGRSMKMEHYQIRDMMSRHESPELGMLLTASGSGNPAVDADLAFSLLNTGGVIAKHAGWHVEFENARVVSVAGCSDLTAANKGRPIASWDQDYGSVIHPIPISVRTGFVRLAVDNLALPVIARVLYYCEGMTAVQQTFRITEFNSVWRVEEL